MTDQDRRDIGARLENWSRWATAGQRTIGISPTGAICDKLRRAALGDDPGHGERRAVDEPDAVLLERVMRDLETKHRLMIWWCYIQQAQPEVVCRKLSIAHRPATVFVEEFRQAQIAVQKLLDENGTRQYIPSHNLIPSRNTTRTVP